jgi:CheY-like chemotaxis protein
MSSAGGKQQATRQDQFAGTDGYVSKPVQAKEPLKAIEAHLPLPAWT